VAIGPAHDAAAAAGIVRKTTCGRRRLVVKLRASVSSSFIAANRSILAGRALAMPTAPRSAETAAGGGGVRLGAVCRRRS